MLPSSGEHLVLCVDVTMRITGTQLIPAGLIDPDTGLGFLVLDIKAWKKDT